MYYEKVFRELNKKGVRYLVVGGMAVVLHGIVRLTADLDLMIDLSKDNVLKFISSMDSLGYKPRLPVAAEEFADEEKRKQWSEEKNMTVFSFFDPKMTIHLVDVFVDYPINFEEAYSRKEIINAADLAIPVVALEDLVALKKISGREQDLADIESIKELNDGA
jgi:predicted nucleotidyltransferase